MLLEQGQPKPGGRGGGDVKTSAGAKDLSRGRRVQRFAGQLNDDAGSTIALTGPQGRPTPPSRTGKNSTMEGLGVGGQSGLIAAGTNSEKDLLEQQQMWREVRVSRAQRTRFNECSTVFSAWSGGFHEFNRRQLVVF